MAIRSPAQGAGGGMTYYDRGDPSAVDFNSLTTDGSEHSIDWSGTGAPANSVALIKTVVQDGTTNVGISFKETGDSNNIAISTNVTQVADKDIHSLHIVKLDGSSECIYLASNTTFTTLTATLMGWWA